MCAEFFPGTSRWDDAGLVRDAKYMRSRHLAAGSLTFVTCVAHMQAASHTLSTVDIETRGTCLELKPNYGLLTQSTRNPCGCMLLTNAQL